MPIYEYKCNSCGEVQEVLHKSMGKIESVKCSSCGSDDLTRLISVASVSMGGSSSSKGLTCCGREERCSTPPCSTEAGCRRN